MPFAMTPEDGLPRIMRYLDPHDFPHGDVVAVLDKEQNILRINRAWLSKMSDVQLHQLLRTHRRLITAQELGLAPNIEEAAE